MHFTRGIRALGTVAIAASLAFSGVSTASANSVSDILGMFNTNSLNAVSSLPAIHNDSNPTPTDPAPSPYLSIEQKRDRVERDLIRAINDMRRNYSLPVAALDTRLSLACREWSENMVHNGIRHATLDERGMTNENLRFTTESHTTAGASSVSAWLNSPGHRAILLDPETRAFGVGAAWDDARGGWMVTYRMYT